ncbi:hypothetical protein N7G274_006152 [Stereocaulon virgatum]|uniref:Uncharacterized protein n=1 Tax=Stereocaulon virgatum TaxID=373712 RepID=A0ABR4A9T4_9LECA
MPSSRLTTSETKGPIKLCLQIASRLAEAFDWLLDAYARIGESLPVFSTVDNLISSHRQDCVQQILSNIYEDTLSFHQRAVIFFKQSTWTIAFKTTFRTFSDLFGDVTKNLQRSKELLIQSASVTHFQEAQDARLLLTREFSAQRDRHQEQQRLAVVSWLSHTPCDFLHVELQDMRHKYPDITRWIFDTVQISEWLRKDGPSSPILWLCGIPGAGERILFSSITDHIKTKYPNAQVIYFYCKEKDPVRDNFVDVARSLIAQILELNPICIHYLYDKALNSVERSLSSKVT